MTQSVIIRAYFGFTQIAIENTNVITPYLFRVATFLNFEFNNNILTLGNEEENQMTLWKK